MHKVYPAIIHNDDDGLWISFPDLEGCYTSGKDIDDLMQKAEEAMGLYLATLVEKGYVLPVSTAIENIRTDAKESKTYIRTDVDRFHRDMKAVKKTVSIPGWQARAAEKKQISLSKVLQQALDTMLQ